MHQKIDRQKPIIISGNFTRWVANTINCQFIVDRIVWPNHRWQWTARGLVVPEKRIIGPIGGRDAIEVARMLNLREIDGKLIRFNRSSYR